jgi:hypothetical protein
MRGSLGAALTAIGIGLKALTIQDFENCKTILGTFHTPEAAHYPP